MPADISVETLFGALGEERKTGELLKLDKDFYEIAESYIAKEEASADENTRQEAENLKKLLSALRAVRERKILIYLAYNKQISSPAPSVEISLYTQIKKIIEGRNPESDALARIKVNADIPEIVTPKGSRLGPLKQNQIIEVERGADLDFILQNKIGEII